MTQKHIFSIEKLLGALIMIATLSGTFFGWQGERAISKLDQIGVELTQTHTRVDSLAVSAELLRKSSADQESRITYLEATHHPPIAHRTP